MFLLIFCQMLIYHLLRVVLTSPTMIVELLIPAFGSFVFHNKHLFLMFLQIGQGGFARLSWTCLSICAYDGSGLIQPRLGLAQLGGSALSYKSSGQPGHFSLSVSHCIRPVGQLVCVPLMAKAETQKSKQKSAMPRRAWGWVQHHLFYLHAFG